MFQLVPCEKTSLTVIGKMQVKQGSDAWEFWYLNFELSIICNSGETKCPALRGWYNEAFYYICRSFNSQRSHFLGIINRMNVLSHFCTAVAKYPVLSNKWEKEAHAFTAPEEESSKVEYGWLLHSQKERNTEFSYSKGMKKERKRGRNSFMTSISHN